METLKKFFPLSFKERKTGSDLAVGIIIYVVAGLIVGAVLALLGWLIGLIGGIVAGLLGTLLGIIGTVVEVYIVAGIVLQILYFCKVLKD